jgi:hypothetical protein
MHKIASNLPSHSMPRCPRDPLDQPSDEPHSDDAKRDPEGDGHG